MRELLSLLSMRRAVPAQKYPADPNPPLPFPTGRTNRPPRLRAAASTVRPRCAGDAPARIRAARSASAAYHDRLALASDQPAHARGASGAWWHVLWNTPTAATGGGGWCVP